MQENRTMKTGNDIGGRVTALRIKLGLKQTEFAAKIGVTSSLISRIEKGETPLTEANIHLICLTFGVREEWLRDGNGEMLNDKALLSEREGRLLELFRRLSPKAQEMIIEYVEKLLADEQALRGEALEALKQAPGGTTSPMEASQGDERGINPIHNKDRG
jgi:transcriptional regulator with XRE-family HTH domain